jgi:predicted ATPase/serine phosphatase RsbU (regulator of sigma subunit)/tRNA A-37 threonylcarbamoyl transferase component Bud32
MIIIPGYEILETLYESEITIVCRSHNHQAQQNVIIKILNQQYPSLTELARFKHEYEIIKNLDLDGIVKVYKLENYQNSLALFLEDFGGESLDRYLQSRKIEIREFLEIAIQLAEILGQLNRKNIIHKDIKPQNILINPQTKQVKITDFSIASILSKENQTISNPNLLEGTLAYISPEQTGRMNRSIDYRTDFYSLGITLYEILVGQLPFNTTDMMELVHCHIAKQPVPPVETTRQEAGIEEIPPVISDIVMKLLAKTAEDRYQSAFGLKADLETCLSQLENTGKISDFPLAKQDLSSQFQIPQKLYGREEQVAQLLATFDRVSEQGITEMILVAGYSGIGKSALVNEVHKPIVRQRGYFISGKFDQFKRNIPYASVIQAFQDLMRQLLTESEAQIQIWKAKLLEALGSNGQIVIDVIPEVELIVGKQQPVPQLGSTESQNRFNFVFQKFIGIFARPEHPLVLFLDDLQWADSASLNLIELLMTNSDHQYLLLIGAYRDNEVDNTHPFVQMVDRIEKSGAAVSAIGLQPLDISHVNQLIADTLSCKLERSQPLAKLLCHKTNGNPFFLTQLLKTIYQENLLLFNPLSFSQTQEGNREVEAWQWDIKQIQEYGITDNVVELMVGKIKKLYGRTQNVLQLAACIGNRFDLNILSIVNEKSLADTADDLWNALQEGLILPLSDTYKIAQIIEQNSENNRNTIPYKFLHDRVQQAAYSLIPSEDKKQIHLKLGQLLLQNTNLQEREEKIFDIVNQLNFSTELLIEQSQRDELAALNLIAGKKAKASTAYEPAVRYLNVALELLASDSWQSQYDLTLDIYKEAVEAEYLNSNLDRAATLFEFALKQAKTILDRVKIYEIKIKLEMSQNQMDVALDTGLQALEMLEVKLSQEPLEKLVIEDLIDLPEMSDPYQLAAMRILVSTVSPAFIAHPDLVLPIILTMVKISCQYGNSVFAIYPYGLYGLVLCGGMGEIDAGYKFGQLAMKLLDCFDAREIQCKVLHLVSSCILHWKNPAKELLKIQTRCIDIGMETGDLDYACYAAMYHCFYIFVAGDNLDQIVLDQAKNIAIIDKCQKEFPFYYAKIWRQISLNLSGIYADDQCSLIGESFNEAEMLPYLIEVNNRHSIFALYFGKAFLLYLYKNYERSLEYTKLAIEYAEPMITTTIYCDHNFYYSLALLGCYLQHDSSQQAENMALVKENQAKMQLWASHIPANHRHKYELVEAEKARVLGETLRAMKYYDRAIQSAKESEYIACEALANELAAEFYLSLEIEKIARTYIIEAHYCYSRWGSQAKVEDLESRYPHLISKASADKKPGVQTITQRTSTTKSKAEVLDLATVIKASQAIGSEIVLEQLLQKLMKIIIENAGAQVGYLIGKERDRLYIEASGLVDSDEVTVLQSIPIASSQSVSSTIINYVARTQESVILNDASSEGNFTQDPYIIQNQPKSILCFPLINQGQLSGIVYLENNLSTGAFTSDRLAVLKILSSQAAISIDNARLYQNLEDKVKERTAQLAEANQEISSLNELLKQDNLRMSAELDIVKQLQQMVLPKQSELEAIAGLEIAGFMEPADEVGGDYYDVLQQDDRVKISIGDVTGHGLESGVLMIMAQTAVRTLQKMNETDPVKFLDVINQTLYDNLQRMDSPKNMSLAILDYAGGILKLSGQHEETIVVRADGTLECIDTMDLGFPIGLVDEIGDFVNQTEVQLHPGDLVVLYTDGIPEAFDINQAQYGLERLWQVVVENRHLSAAEIREAAIDDVRRYIGDQKVFDDITLVVIKQK